MNVPDHHLLVLARDVDKYVLSLLSNLPYVDSVSLELRTLIIGYTVHLLINETVCHIIVNVKKVLNGQ